MLENHGARRDEVNVPGSLLAQTLLPEAHSAPSPYADGADYTGALHSISAGCGGLEAGSAVPSAPSSRRASETFWCASAWLRAQWMEAVRCCVSPNGRPICMDHNRPLSRPASLPTGFQPNPGRAVQLQLCVMRALRVTRSPWLFVSPCASRSPVVAFDEVIMGHRIHSQPFRRW